jgi:hypothetical protein
VTVKYATQHNCGDQTTTLSHTASDSIGDEQTTHLAAAESDDPNEPNGLSTAVCVRAESGWKVGCGCQSLERESRAGNAHKVKHVRCFVRHSFTHSLGRHWARWACASLHLPPPPPRAMANAIERRAIARRAATLDQSANGAAHMSLPVVTAGSRLLGALTTSRHHFDTRKTRAEAPHRAHGPPRAQLSCSDT